MLRSLSGAARHAVSRFFGRVKNFLKEAILAGAMALNGPGPIDHEDLAEVDRQTAVQVGFLNQFEQDVHLRTPKELAPEQLGGVIVIQPDAMTSGHFIARAEMYGNAVWTATGNTARRKAIASGKYTEERRLHFRPRDMDDPCSTCRAESARGWVPVGTLLELGDSVCRGNGCDCYYEFRKAA